MPVHLPSQSLVVVDGHPGSDIAMSLANEHTDTTFAFASVTEGSVADAEHVIRSSTMDPTLIEALKVAGERGIPWIGVRRDFMAPTDLLRELIVGTGRAPTTDSTPGFAVLIAGETTRPWRRALAIIDRSTGPISGFMAFIATVVAEKTGAELDILVLGAPGEEIAADDESDNVAINREQEYYQEALLRAREAGIDPNWITVTDPGDKWAVVQSQLSSGDYDLVIDEIGDVAIGGGLRRGLRIEDATGPGQVGELSLKLIESTDRDLLLVIDSVRLGLGPSRLARMGAVAAAALTIVAGGAGVARSAGAAGLAAGGGSSAPDSNATATALLNTLGTQLSDATAEKDRTKAAKDSSRSKTKKTVKKVTTKTVKAPKGGAKAKQVKAAKSELKKSQKDYQKAKKALAAAKEHAAEVAAAQQAAAAEAARAQREVTAASQTTQEAQAAAEDAAAASSGVLGLLPGGPTKEDAAVAAQSADGATEWLDSAVDRGAAAAGTLGVTAEAAEVADKALADAAAQAAAAKSELTVDKATAATYQESYEKAQAKARAKARAEAERKAAAARKKMANSRRSPVASGSYNLTARYGQPGGWSRGYHTGLDFAASPGTTVSAAASGTVVSTGYDGAYGNRVVIRHANGYYTTYNHLSSISVSTGQEVSTGDHVGAVGSTGNSTGPHLHFEVTQGGDGWSGGSFVNPASWLGW